MSYEIAIECARAMGRVRSFELGRRAGIDWRVAAAYLDRMEQNGLVTRMDPRGWRHAIVIAQATEPESRGHRTDREEGRGRGAAKPSDEYCRLSAVRQLIARELHPDLSDDSLVRALKTELFKRIWPQINEVLRPAA